MSFYVQSTFDTESRDYFFSKGGKVVFNFKADSSWSSDMVTLFFEGFD
jgi:hypothetical protein